MTMTSDITKGMAIRMPAANSDARRPASEPQSVIVGTQQGAALAAKDELAGGGFVVSATGGALDGAIHDSGLSLRGQSVGLSL